VRRGGYEIRGCDFCRIQGARTEGVALEQEIREHLRGSSMRLLGPNCLGLMNPKMGLNALRQRCPKVGNVAFLSQSGALLSAILDWSYREEVGFSAIVSTGSMLDLAGAI